MKYAVEMGSGAMVYVPYWFRHSKVDIGDTQKHRQDEELISLYKI
jgi:hypothetical protein